MMQGKTALVYLYYIASRQRCGLQSASLTLLYLFVIDRLTYRTDLVKCLMLLNAYDSQARIQIVFQAL